MRPIRSILIPLALGLFSCEGILDKEPIAILDAGSFFQTEEDAVQALNAAYQPLLFSNNNNNFYWAFAVIASDEAITGGDGSRAGLAELDAFTYTPRTEEFNDFWKTDLTCASAISPWAMISRTRCNGKTSAACGSI